MTSIPDNQPEQDIPGAPQPEPTEAGSAGAAESGKPDIPAVNGDTSLADDAMTLLSEHKGKLAIGVAATLGMMVYYGWREKRLAKTDPEEYARLQRLKAVVRHSDDVPRVRTTRKPARHNDAAQAGTAGAGSDGEAGATPGADTTPEQP